MKRVIILALGATLFCTSLHAKWEDLLKAVQDTEKLDESGKEVSGKLYNATVKYSIINGNNDNKLSGNEKINLTIIGAEGKEIRTPNALTIEELRVWAKHNADALMKAIFKGEPSTTITGIPTSTTSTASTYRQMKLLHTINTTFLSKIMFDSETTSANDGVKDIDSNGGILHYTTKFDSGNSVGILISYRYSSTDDRYDSKMANVAFTPFYKINADINKNFSLGTIINLTGNTVYLDSSIFPDGAGYFEYGGGVGVIPKYQFNESFFIDGTLGYQYMKKYIPSSLVPDEVDFITDAINNLKALQTLSYGIGAQYNIKKEWRINGDILQIKQLVTDDIEKGRDKATYYTISSTYDWKKWSFGLGYKTVKDVEDYSEDSYMLTLKYRW